MEGRGAGKDNSGGKRYRERQQWREEGQGKTIVEGRGTGKDNSGGKRGRERQQWREEGQGKKKRFTLSQVWLVLILDSESVSEPVFSNDLQTSILRNYDTKKTTPKTV